MILEQGVIDSLCEYVGNNSSVSTLFSLKSASKDYAYHLKMYEEENLEKARKRVKEEIKSFLKSKGKIRSNSDTALDRVVTRQEMRDIVDRDLHLLASLRSYQRRRFYVIGMTSSAAQALTDFIRNFNGDPSPLLTDPFIDSILRCRNGDLLNIKLKNKIEKSLKLVVI